MRQNSSTLVITPDVGKGALKGLKGYTVKGKHRMREEFLRQRGTRQPSVWVSGNASWFSALADVISEPKGDLRLLLLSRDIKPAQREYLNTLFRNIVAPDHEIGLLPHIELAEALSAENPDELFVGGVVDSEDQVVVLYRGNLDRLAVAFDWFTFPSSTEKPDFRDFEVTDYGQTVRLGEYEAAADAILYEFDPEFRRKVKRRALKRDKSLGGAIRRLRLQKGLTQKDFPGVSARQIGRIERGETDEPRPDTLIKIADRMGVDVRELSSY